MNHKTTRLALVPFVVLMFCLALVAGLGLGRVALVRANPDTRYVDDLLGSDTANDCTILTAPCKTIGRAINQAVDGDEIVIAAGTYTETLTVQNRVLTFSGAGQGSTIIDGGGVRNVFYILQGSVVTITGVTIQHGHTETSRPGGGVFNLQSTVLLSDVTVYSNTATTDGGGGLANWEGSMTLINTTVVSNTSDGHGGGIRNINTGASLVLINSSVLSNTATQSGGGIRNSEVMTMTNGTLAGNRANGGSSYGGGLYNYGSATLIDVTVRDNEVPNGSGGGICNWTGSALRATGGTIANNHAGSDSNDNGGGVDSYQGNSVTLVDVTVEGNTTAGRGGGIRSFRSLLTIRGSTFYSNSSASLGGGLFAAETELTIDRSAYISNTSMGWGGGLYLFNLVTATIDSSVVVGNSAHGEGGGIFAGGTSTTLVLTNTTISGNSTWVYGGGIESRVPMTVTNCTIVDNVADSDNNGSGSGGGLFNYYDGQNTAVATFLNTIIANNVDMGGQPPDCDNANGATTISLGHNLVEIVGDCTFSAGGDLTGQDPVLGPLADNGGDTWTHALLSGSPALNAGDDAGCPDTDQRGYRRVPPCDIGAYEHTLRAFLPLALRNY